MASQLSVKYLFPLDALRLLRHCAKWPGIAVEPRLRGRHAHYIKHIHLCLQVHTYMHAYMYCNNEYTCMRICSCACSFKHSYGTCTNACIVVVVVVAMSAASDTVHFYLYTYMYAYMHAYVAASTHMRLCFTCIFQEHVRHALARS
jgi:hypothetical protein